MKMQRLDGLSRILFGIGWIGTGILTIVVAFGISTWVGVLFVFLSIVGPFSALILGIFWGIWGPKLSPPPPGDPQIRISIWDLLGITRGSLLLHPGRWCGTQPQVPGDQFSATSVVLQAGGTPV